MGIQSKKWSKMHLKSSTLLSKMAKFWFSRFSLKIARIDSHLVHQIEDYMLKIAVNGGIYYHKCSVARDGPLIESLEKNWRQNLCRMHPELACPRLICWYRVVMVEELFTYIFGIYLKFGYKNPSFLTLSGMGRGIFSLLSLLDQILSADSFFKNYLEVKIEIYWVILTTCPAH